METKANIVLEYHPLVAAYYNNTIRTLSFCTAKLYFDYEFILFYCMNILQ